MTDDFLDREIHRHNFKRHLFDVKTSGLDGGLLPVYSGVGRVGKTSLLKRFEKIIADESAEKFVRYDFTLRSKAASSSARNSNAP